MDLVCLQETKIQEMNIALVYSIMVGRFLDWKALNAGGLLGEFFCFGRGEGWS